MAAVIAVIAVIACFAHDALAGRKRVVVLDFEGPKAEKFHDAVVALIKKSHTVIPSDKWSGTAEELDAGKVTAKNVKKVAKKLKIDGIVTGKVEKRRDEYILRLTLRGGKSGEQVGNGVDTKADGAHLEGKALRDVKDELVDAIDQLDVNRGGGGDDDDDKPAVKKKPAAKKGDDDDDDKPKKSAFVKHKDDETGGDKVGAKKKPAGDDDESPLPKGKKKPAASDDTADDDDGAKKKSKKVAAKDEDGGEVEASAEPESKLDGAAALSPSQRAVDAVIGLSVTQRKLAFNFSSNLGNTPPGYRGVPVAGVLLDATIYPLAIGHKRDDMLKNLGLTLMLDRVIHISSQVKLADGTTSKLSTTEQRFAIGASFRYPIGKDASAPVVGATLRVGQQSFSIDPGALMPAQVDIPNVGYTIIDPEVFFRYPATPKITLNVSLGYELITGGGAISETASYGPGSISGFEGEASVDYLITKNIFARAAFRFETIGLSFKGTGDLSNNRDGDPSQQDVFGARDTYLGGAVTVGYVY